MLQKFLLIPWVALNLPQMQISNKSVNLSGRNIYSLRCLQSAKCHGFVDSYKQQRYHNSGGDSN